ncbi:MAG: 3-hydroxyacyl-CoA dehydrogenase NAD-binding domain-containing protein [Pseudomonadota bacterium]
MSRIFRLDTDADGIATIVWDLPDASMNVLTEAGLRELDAHVDTVLADDHIRGAILTSAKRDFAGGMDLSVLASLKARAEAEAAGGANPAETLFGFVQAVHAVLRKIERGGADPKTLKGGKPFVWAAPGTAVGIGLELGLACHHRIAADRAEARIGLPEIKVGLFPGAGGTTRLLRMIGLLPAAPYLLEGRTVAPAKAKAAGLIDAVTAPEALLDKARAWILAAEEGAAVKPWERKGYQIPGGAPYTRAGFETFLGAVAMVHGRTQGCYPAAKAMLAALYEGALVPFDTALRIEARRFVSVLLDPTAEAMIRTLFLAKQALEKGAARPKAEPDARVKRLGVLGAGMMGAGIAHAAATAGIEVVLLDRDREAAKKGLARIAAILDEGVKKKRVTPEAREAALARVQAGDGYAALADTDLVIEAVFEDPALKAQVTARAGEHLGPKTILATNTSTLPITDLAAASPDPARYIGIHFFSPVHKMNLVEIIKGRATGPAALAKALDFVRQIKKTPIVVNDARFFYANRCIIPYVNEGLILVSEGVAPALIENAARAMGMPVGPLQLIDETSLELGLSIQQATAAAMGAAYTRSGADEVLERLVGEGRLGRKAGAGLYDYDARGKRSGLWPGLAAIWAPLAVQPLVERVQDRLRFIQALEAVRALEEGVLEDVRAGDVGAILGWGFMPWSGGPFSWIDRLSAAEALTRAERLAQDHGARFAPPEALRRMASTGARFYPLPAQEAA